MRIQSPSMSELHAFEVVARLGSFTRAADVLCVTQGAVSRAVSRLESHFGQVLLKRSAHGLTLTGPGRQLLLGIQEPLAQIEAASAALLRGRAPQTLTIAVVPTLASVWLVPRLPDFHRRHPEVQLRFVPYRKDEDFSDATPDGAIMGGTGDSQWPTWTSDYIIGHKMAPICHPDRLAARRAEGRWTHPRELASEPLLYHTTAPGNWTQWLRAVGAAKAKPNLAHAFDQVSILVRATIADMGVALVQRCLVREEIASGQLVMPFDLPVELPRGYFFCTLPKRRDMPAMTLFREWLLEVAAKDAVESKTG